MDKFDYSDVKRVPIEADAETELCVILYSSEYKELIGLFLGLMKENELSERALAVTTAVIDVVPALYTAWNYRFEICVSLYSDQSELWEKELDWLDELTLNNPKNYQIWSYRQALVQQHPCPNFVRELPILDLMIDDDTKNYHVWSYRKWSVQFFDVWSHELEFVNKYIDRDVYNNSAWTHRAFYFKNQVTKEEQHKGLVNTEIEYVKAKISLAPQNVSPWNYLRFVYRTFKDDEYDSGIVEFASRFVQNVLDEGDSNKQAPGKARVDSTFALELLADAYAKNDPAKSKVAYTALADTWDPIRKNYWSLKANQLG
ncbi:protein farnesyltransferase/ geranylgeranyltransferase type-1 subunit alpha [Kluyveromyces marxianus]|nr:protein farnesyltransferase/ geranylgeranyltransferase type-1 subunit alpha [Kluyveromyces marxianus]